MFPFNRQFKIQMESAFEKKRYQVTRWIIHQRLVDIQIPRFGRWPISIIYIKRDMETQVTRVIPLVSINNIFPMKMAPISFQLRLLDTLISSATTFHRRFDATKRNLSCFDVAT